MIKVRQATASDAHVVVALVDALLKELNGSSESQLSLETLSLALNDEGWRRTAFIAEDENSEIIGVLTLTETFAMYANGPYGVIDELYVIPAKRSAGIGRQLIAASIDYSKAMKWPRLVVTAPDNDPGGRVRKFYEDIGFKFSGPKLRIDL